MGLRNWLVSLFRKRPEKPDYGNLGDDYGTIVELQTALDETEQRLTRSESVRAGLEEKVDLMDRAAEGNTKKLAAAREEVKRKDVELQRLRNGAYANTRRLAGQIVDEAARAVMGVHLLVGGDSKIKGLCGDLLSYLGYTPEGARSLVGEDLSVLFAAKDGGMKNICKYLELDNGAREKVRWGFYGRDGKVFVVKPMRVEPFYLDVDNVEGIVPDDRWERPLGYRIGFDIRSIWQRMMDAVRSVRPVESDAYEGEAGLASQRG